MSEIPEKYLEHMEAGGDLADCGWLSLKGNTLVVHIQAGPRKEHGDNGGQIDDVIRFCRGFLESANSGDFRSRETSLAITKLQEAEHWLAARTADREERGVEGRDQA